MSDLDSYLTHCYDLLLKSAPIEQTDDTTELCACTTLVHHNESH